MTQKTVLTRKEVIVVLGCVAFFTLNLMAAGGATRRRAKYIVCQANLKQWGQIFSLFAQDNEGKLPPSVASPGTSSQDAFWLGATRPYYQDPKTLVCPSTKPNTIITSRTYGSTFKQWGPFPSSGTNDWWTSMSAGSYGLNDWCANPPESTSFIWGFSTANTWRTITAEGGNNIPLLLDSFYVDGFPLDTDTPPIHPDQYDGWNFNAMKLFCMDRHNGGINGIFLDLSVRKINPKELWKLKWHKDYDTNNFWTLPGAPWPIWMQEY